MSRENVSTCSRAAETKRFQSAPGSMSRENRSRSEQSPERRGFNPLPAR